MGRKSTFTQERAEQILQYLREGESLIVAAEKSGVARTTVIEWTKDKRNVLDSSANEEGVKQTFADEYARAREIGWAYHAEEILRIADEERLMVRTKTDKEGKTYEMEVDAVERSRLQIDARKWLLSKMLPKVYGDKIETTVQGPNGGPVEITEIRRTIVDAKGNGGSGA